LINFMRDYQVAHGVALAQSYNVTMYILVGFLLAGLACNLSVTPVDALHHFGGVAANDAVAATPVPAGRVA
jgi:hypothetical protein